MGDAAHSGVHATLPLSSPNQLYLALCNAVSTYTFRVIDGYENIHFQAKPFWELRKNIEAACQQFWRRNCASSGKVTRFGLDCHR
jgi:hypothetical protein